MDDDGDPTFAVVAFALFLLAIIYAIAQLF